jgi:hypothetical protein
MSNTAPYPIVPELVAITIAYRNQSYIADQVLPRQVRLSTQEFRYWSYPIEETFALPDTRVGRKGRPNEVSLTATELTAKTDDYGLEDPIPQADIDNAPAGYSPVGRSVEQLTDYIMLDREKRVAELVFDPAQYPASNKVQLSGDDRWSAAASASDPIEDIVTGLDACLVRPNCMVMGQAVWTKLARHPKIMKAIHGTEGDTGIARRQQIADLFELEEVLIGQQWLNTAKKGQTASLSRVWGKHCLLFHRNRNADNRSGLTFGYTAEWGGRVAGQRSDPDIGLRGGVRVRVGESVKELIVAPRAAYLIQDAVS